MTVSPYGVEATCPTDRIPAQTIEKGPASFRLRGHGQRGLSSMSGSTIQPGFCQCGCGTKVGVWLYNDTARRRVRGEYKRYANNHQPRGGPSRPIADRLWEKAHIAGPDDCWEWFGSKAKFGYGMLKIDGKSVRAHRVAYEVSKGPIGDGLFVCHTCDNPPCINPNHLWLGTNADNTADRHIKGRSSKGESAGRAKLSVAESQEIRSRYPGETQRALAEEFGVSTSTIGNVISGEHWSCE